VINEVPGFVKQTGTKNYSYCFNTGPDGEIWLFNDNPDPTQWNITVSVSSAQLAVNGYHGTKEVLYGRLEVFGAKIISESLQRVDFAVDFIAPDFEIPLDLVVCHSHCKQFGHGEAVKDIPEGGTDWNVGFGRRKLQTFTIGKMPGRQVQIYNKRAEVARKLKTHWYEVWGFKKKDCPEIWRVELRAGKSHLKSWGITTFDQLEDRMGNMFASAVQSVRLVDHAPEKGENVSRIGNHPLWALLTAEVEQGLKDHVIPGITRKKIVEGRRDEIQKMYRAQLWGLAVSYAVAMGMDPVRALNEFTEFLANDFSAYAETDSKKFVKRFRKADERLFF